MDKHGWIEAVLFDIAAYAEANQLHEVHSEICTALAKVAPSLRNHAGAAASAGVIAASSNTFGRPRLSVVR